MVLRLIAALAVADPTVAKALFKGELARWLP
jgi:hypothetical protein